MGQELTAPVRASLPDKMQYAKAMAGSNLLPRQYQGQPANLLFALEYADALGVSPINAITSIHVIEGKPTASADLIAGLVRRAGHKLRISGDDTYATAQIIRADDPDFTYEVTWTLDRAKAAGLLGKGVWKAYPAAMLRSRAITEVARMGASDALYGVIYTPEEIGADVDIDGDPVGGPVASPVEVVADVAVVDGPEPMKQATRSHMFALFTELGITDADRQRAGMSRIVGREVDSRGTLTEDEARAVVADLLARKDAAQAAVGDPDDPALFEGGDPA